MMLSLDEAEFICLFVESLVVGIFVTLASVTVLTHYRTSGTRGLVLQIVFIMVILTVGHVSTDFVGALRQILPVDPVFFLTPTGGALFGADIFFVGFQTLLGDLILIWRCYVLYSRQLKASLFPVICFLGYLVTFIGNVQSWFSNPIDSPVTFKWITACLALNVAVNMYTTAAISLWCINRARYIRLGWRTLWPIILVVAESGVLYTITILATLVAHVRGSFSQIVFMGMQPSVVGITYCLLVLQIKSQFGLNKSQATETGILDTVDLSIAPTSPPQSNFDLPASSTSLSAISRKNENMHISMV